MFFVELTSDFFFAPLRVPVSTPTALLTYDASEGALLHLPLGSPNSSVEEGGGQLVRPNQEGGQVASHLKPATASS